VNHRRRRNPVNRLRVTGIAIQVAASTVAQRQLVVWKVRVTPVAFVAAMKALEQAFETLIFIMGSSPAAFNFMAAFVCQLKVTTEKLDSQNLDNVIPIQVGENFIEEYVRLD
jgi:hypothetical protein